MRTPKNEWINRPINEKSSRLRDYTDNYYLLIKIINLLNQYPRKRLGCGGPSLVLFQQQGVALQRLIQDV